jgi:hypothetical protein
MESRDWQVDMNGCKGLPPAPWSWIETDNGELVFGSEEMIFDGLLGGDVNKEKFFRFMINAPEALPYWLQQYAAEKERVIKAEQEIEHLKQTSTISYIQKKRRDHDREATMLVEEVIKLEKREQKLKEAINEALKWTWYHGEANMKEIEEGLQETMETLYPLEREDNK